ncbi:MAG: hypothetical protein HN831_04915 [Waddliaceae bacterium]|nr:hypothetical protein [Waddliaceae bacterium]
MEPVGSSTFFTPAVVPPQAPPETVYCEAINPHASPFSSEKIPTVREVVEFYKSEAACPCFFVGDDPDKSEYSSDPSKAFYDNIGYKFGPSDEALSLVLRSFCADKFPLKLFYNPREEYGYVIRRDIPAGTHLHVRTDIHGTVRSVVEDLEFLKGKGYLDEDYLVIRNPNGTPKVMASFLGDYIDRGNNSNGVLYLLALFKIKNPKETILIRGNHDGKCYIHRRVITVTLKDHFFARMPLAACLCHETPPEGKPKQYVFFSHGGAPDIHVVGHIAKLIREGGDSIALPYRSDDTSYPSIIADNLLPRGRTVIAMHDLEKFIFERCSDLTPSIRKILKIYSDISTKDLRRKAKQVYYAQKIYEHTQKFFSKPFNPHESMITWTRMSEDTAYDSYKYLNPRIIQSLLWLIGAKAAVRGHDHEYRVYHLKTGILNLTTSRWGLVHTLPISGYLHGNFSSVHNDEDLTYLLKTSPRVDGWKRILVQRNTTSSMRRSVRFSTTVSDPKTFYHKSKGDDCYCKGFSDDDGVGEEGYYSDDES